MSYFKFSSKVSFVIGSWNDTDEHYFNFSLKWFQIDREEYKRCNDECERLRKWADLMEKTQGSSTVCNFGQADATVEGTSSVVLGELIALTTSQWHKAIWHSWVFCWPISIFSTHSQQRRMLKLISLDVIRPRVVATGYVLDIWVCWNWLVYTSIIDGTR